jgi:hypothetical protein
MLAVRKLFEYERLRKQEANGSLESFLDEAGMYLSESHETVPLVRDYLKGYIAHEKFRLSLLPVRFFDRLLFKKRNPNGYAPYLAEAIRYYTIALERAADRVRLRRLCLMQMGELYLLAGQAALASATFESAFAMPSQKFEEDLNLSILSARSFALSGRPQLAAQRIEEMLGRGKSFFTAKENKATELQLKKMLSFYFAESGKFQESCKVTKEYSLSVLEDASVFKNWKETEVGQWEHAGFACMRSKSIEDLVLGKKILAQVLQYSESKSLSTIERTQSRGDFLDFSPSQLKARASGLLAQSEGSSAMKSAFLSKRKLALFELLESSSETAFDKRSQRLALAKVCAQLAAAKEKTLEQFDCIQDQMLALSKSGSILQARDDFSAFRSAALLLFAHFKSNGRFDGFENRLTGLVNVFDTNPPGKVSENDLNSFGDELQMSYLKTWLVMDLLRSIQEKCLNEEARFEEVALADQSLWKASCLKKMSAKPQVAEKLRKLGLPLESSSGKFEDSLRWYSGMLGSIEN